MQIETIRRRMTPLQSLTTVRVPRPLREKLIEAAERNGRSESAEVRSRLELSFALEAPRAG